MKCNGDFLQKDPDEAIEYLNDLAEKAHTWIGPNASDRTNRSRPQGNSTSTNIYYLREEDNLRAKVESLTRELESLRAKDSKPTHVVSRVTSEGERGKFPAQAQPNLKGQHMAQISGSEETHFEEANAVTTRSGKVVELTPPPRENQKEPSEPDGNSPSENVVENPARIPFSQALKSTSKSTDVKVDVNFKIPIILGRPFLATVNALINCRNSLMKLTFGNMTLEVNIFHVTKQPTEDDECHQTYMIDVFTQ
ncbi:uncharacterized protein LOC111406177 [Olea europaea var. sylvestris]|uniref:uncharacterized protein LOC111406177 n=1 Tax=Olea europaea var. sylvestris TaxID=158386 RepID=UPI000C1CF429|nr:uncharacterized protein LOC111406177 [Olea europaea var. sylvestris]